MTALTRAIDSFKSETQTPELQPVRDIWISSAARGAKEHYFDQFNDGQSREEGITAKAALLERNFEDTLEKIAEGQEGYTFAAAGHWKRIELVKDDSLTLFARMNSENVVIVEVLQATSYDHLEAQRVYASPQRQELEQQQENLSQKPQEHELQQS